MEIILVRHGEPAWISGGKPNLNPPLTDRGQLQAERVAIRLADSKPSVAELLVSPAIRAQQTAQPIADKTGLPQRTVADFEEWRLPDWGSSSGQEVAEAFRELKTRSLEAWWDGFAGGEPFRDFEARVRRALFETLAERGIVMETDHLVRMRKDPGRIVIVAHGGTNSVITALLLGIPRVPWEWERIVLHHTSLVRVRAVPLGGGHVFALRSQNDCEHLPKEMRTR